MMIHPNSRAVITQLAIPAPIKKYFSSQTWDVDLSTNTNPYLGSFAEYPDVCQDHLKAIYLSTVLSLNPESQKKPKLTPENVLFTVGSMEGLDLLLRTFSEPTVDTLCLPTPTFSAYEHWAMIHSLNIVRVPLQGDDLNQLAVDEIVKIHPKLLFLCNPNNPVGSKLDPVVIQELCESLEGFVVVDEAYIEFSDTPSSLYLLNNHKNLIILRTLSKAWGLAGIRCGVILADKSVINALRYVQLPFGLTTLTQHKVKKVLLNPDITFASWHRIKKNRNNLMSELQKLKAVRKIYPSETNFLMCEFNDFDAVLESLRNHKILVLNCSETVPDSLRISIGNEQQNHLLLEAIRAVS